MKALLRTLMLPAMIAFGVVGCSDDDEPMGPGGTPPPDISGTYALVSLTQGGVTCVSPLCTGTFTASQVTNDGTTATGTIDFTVTTPSGMLADAGTYTLDSEGKWTQDTSQQALGTATLVGSSLTVTVTEPPVAASTSVWQRQ